MAVTAIWPIKGRVDKVITYARNPEKTQDDHYEEQAALHAVEGVVEYTADDIKTERRSYVSCVNLLSEESAAQEFIATKRQKGKLDGRTCYHGYAEWQAEKTGKPTQRSTIRADIDRAIKASVTREEFFAFLQDAGYELKLYTKSGDWLEHPALKPPGAKGHPA